MANYFSYLAAITVGLLHGAYAANVSSRALNHILSHSTAYVYPANIQEADCDMVENSADCTTITACEWSYTLKDRRVNKCYWRCDFLNTKADCESKVNIANQAKTLGITEPELSTQWRSRGCKWFKDPSRTTGKQCQQDCTTRTSLGASDCVQNNMCMWTGKICDISCVTYVATECKAMRDKGICIWVNNSLADVGADRSSYCFQDCRTRPDRDTCDPANLGETCQWDDCQRKCKTSTKVVKVDLKWKKVFQLDSDCMQRGVDSSWYWDYQCTGKHSHCFIEDYHTNDGLLWKNKNKCDAGTYNLKHCMPDCEALNKLALDAEYAKSEPTFSTSLHKARHFCERESICSWKNDKCEWKKSCDIHYPSWWVKRFPFAKQSEMVANFRFDMCDEQTCTAARSGGGSSPIDLHGLCDEVKIVQNVGRLRKSRCNMRCELRTSQERCMSKGEGGRIADTYKTKACGPMKMRYSDGIPDDTCKLDSDCKFHFPQQCVSQCRWVSNKCLTSCEMRNEKDKCTGSCNWNDNAQTGVIEYGGLPDLIKCTGTPNDGLSTINLAAKAAAEVAKFGTADKPYGPFEKGGAGFVGPVSTCILAKHLANTGNLVSNQAACYTSVALKLDARYESPYVEVVAGAAPASVDPSKCFQDAALNIPTKISMVLSMDQDYVDAGQKISTAFMNGAKWKDNLRTGLAQTFTLLLQGNLDSYSQKYAVDTSFVTVASYTVGAPSTKGTIEAWILDIEFLVSLPEAHRPSLVKHILLGNPARPDMVKGFLLAGSPAKGTFEQFMKQYSWTSAAKKVIMGADDYWKWDCKVTLHSAQPTVPTTVTTTTTIRTFAKSKVTTTNKPAILIAIKIVGSLTLNVPDVDKFLKDKEAQGAVKQGIADAHVVPSSSVAMNVTKVAGGIKLDHTITVAANKTKQDQVKKSAQDVTKTALTEAIQTRVTAVRGANHTISVTGKAAISVAVVAAPAILPAIKIVGSLTLNVPDVDKFLSDKEAQGAVKQGIADAHLVPSSSVAMNVTKARRLALAPAAVAEEFRRRLAGGIKLEYTITIAANKTKQDQVKKSAQDVTKTALTAAIQTKVTAVKGADYTISVTGKAAISVTVVAAPKGATAKLGTASTATSTSSALWAFAFFIVVSVHRHQSC